MGSNTAVLLLNTTFFFIFCYSFFDSKLQTGSKSSKDENILSHINQTDLKINVS